MQKWNFNDNPLGLEVIKTARDIESSNDSTLLGFIPLIRQESPYAAYLVPANLFIGQKVFLEDLIEDYPGITRKNNYGSVTDRATFGFAIWNGKDLEILPELINTTTITSLYKS